MKKLIRDNKVGVVLGNYWYTDHKRLDWALLPELVELVESEEYKKVRVDSFYRNGIKTQLVIDCLLKAGYSFTDEDIKFNKENKEETLLTHKELDIEEDVQLTDCYLEGELIWGSDLRVKWVDLNRDFSIMATDYGEYIMFKDEIEWLNIKE